MLRISSCLVLASAALSLAAVIETPPKCGYESCPQPKDGFLNVHLVAHTHDDVGWLKTVDQYYYGSRNDIQKAGVQYILDSVVKELWEKPDRKFIYVETAFFWKWWMRQPDDVRHKVHVLVREGRLQFVGGAWSMNDEADVHYQSTIDQFTWGHQKLNETFGECGIPRVGWQIDPFGHSREFASLLAGMGYDGLFLGRIDYEDKRSRLQNKNMEMVWRGDDVLGKASDIFTGVNYNTYSPPPGFCFDILCQDEPIIDDPDSPIYNVDKRVSDFLTIAHNMSKAYRTNNILVTMGEDFQYQDAAMWYKNLDKLIEYANLKAAKEGLNITLFYSTPTCYLKAVKDAEPTLPTKQDDFFPYASDPNAFWTGYFTSRPTTKYFEREGNNYLQVAKQLQVLANLEEHNMFVLNELKSVMGVMQHHDAITGTEKEHVTHDYERMLDQAIEDALIIPRQAINKVTQGDALAQPVLNLDRCKYNESSCVTAEKGNNLVVTIYNPLAWEVTEAIRVPVVSDNGYDYEVYDPAGKIVQSQIVPIPTAVKNIPTRESVANYEVVIMPTLPALGYRSYYLKKTTQRTKRNSKSKDNVNYYNINEYWKEIREKPLVEIKNIEDEDVLVIKHNIPDAPINLERNTNVGKTDFDVLKDKYGSRDAKEFEKVVKEEMKGVKHERKRSKERVFSNLNDEEMRMLSDEPKVVEMISDSVVQVEPAQVSVGDSGITYQVKNTTVSISYHYYPGCIGDNRAWTNRSSGAYIFRPNATEPFKVNVKLEGYISGSIVKEARVSGENFGSTLRIYDNFFEIDTVVGPIDIKDNTSKEYIVRYSTNIINNGEFYTDSNGRQLLKRKLDQRPQFNVSLEEPISGNYYPVTNFITIKDNDNNLAIVTDRAEGGTSLAEGQLELMLHRRLLHDDAFGVGEALNETAKGVGLVARIIHRVHMDITPIELRKSALQVGLHPGVFVSDINLTLKDWLNLKNEYSWLNTKLVDGLHLLTLEPWGNDILIRFENINEEPSSLNVDLGDLFKNIKIKSIKETTLSANRWLEDYKKWEWKTEDKFTRNFNEAYGSFEDIPEAENIELKNEDDGLKVNLKSKQIRTFIAKYDYV